MWNHWDKLQAISVLTSDSPKLGPALNKNPYVFIHIVNFSDLYLMQDHMHLHILYTKTFLLPKCHEPAHWYSKDIVQKLSHAF